MKLLALCLVCSVVAVAHAAADPTETAAYKAACGSTDQKYDVALNPPTAVSDTAGTGVARLFVIDDEDQTGAACLSFGKGNCGATVRIGMDGEWVGATQGRSWFALDLPAGKHHLCANWQSHFKKISHNEVFLNSITAAAGQSYFYRLHVSNGNGGGNATVPFSLSLMPLNEDEAQMLLATYPMAVAKKD